jgi:hemoglobin
MPDDVTKLFERLGGAPKLAEIVRETYERVLKDPELAPFFANTSMERLHHMQHQFLASAFDGPVEYAGVELTAIHRGRGITSHHFASFCGHFADAMEVHGIAEQDIDLAMSRLAMFKDKITGDVNFDG